MDRVKCAIWVLKDQLEQAEEARKNTELNKSEQVQTWLDNFFCAFLTDKKSTNTLMDYYNLYGTSTGNSIFTY